MSLTACLNIALVLQAVKRPPGNHARIKQESTYGRMATSRHNSTTSHWPGHHDAGLEAGIRSTLHWIEQTADQPRILVILVGQVRFTPVETVISQAVKGLQQRSD